MILRQVPRVSASEFRPPRWGGEPRIVTGVARDWAAFDRWQVDYLKGVAGDRQVPIRERKGAPRNFGHSGEAGGLIAFRDFLDWALETADEYEAVRGRPLSVQEIVQTIERRGFEASYALDCPLALLSPALLADAPPPAWYPETPGRTVFWCSIFGSSCGLHLDMTPNCNVQIKGRKHFVLFSPSQTRFLYRFGRQSVHCAFDPAMPDFDRFPLARRAQGLECSLNEGEALYIPVGWYHQVTVTSAWALNVNFWWRRPMTHGLFARSAWPQLCTKAWLTLHERARRARERFTRRRPLEDAGPVPRGHVQIGPEGDPRR